jgi:cell division protein FtsQ
VLAAVAIVAGVAWALLDSRFFVVRTIEVTGTHLVTNAEVRATAAIQPGIPLIRVNGAVVARRVEQLQQVQSAQVSRQWPDRVTISVTERTPALAVPSGTSYQLIDKYGVAVEAASRRPRGMPILDLPAGSGPVSSLRGSPAVFAAAVVIQELPHRLARAVATVQAPNASEVTVKLASGVTIVWGGTDRAAAKAAELAVLMRTHARTYDVSAPGTAVTGG